MSKALQAAFDAIDQHQPESDDDGTIAAKAKGLMVGYDARWSDQSWYALDIEQTVVLPVINPETGRSSRTWRQAGKQDGIVGFGEKRYLLEHKTCSEEIADPNAPYWKRLAIDAQVSSYMLQKWQGGEKLSGCLYDVIRKPGIRPKSLSKPARQGIVATAEYCGRKVSPEIQNSVAKGQDRECAELYFARLAADTMDRPEYYFSRRSVPRLDGELVEWADELWDVAKDIQDARKRDRHYRNSQSCMLYGTPCQYLGICSGHDHTESDTWQRRESIHSELEGIQDEQDVLTYSRVRCFQTCRRKHYYRYELGIERADQEEKASLVFGSLLHEALAAWWSCFVPEKEKSNGNSECAVNEVARSGSQEVDAR